MNAIESFLRKILPTKQQGYYCAVQDKGTGPQGQRFRSTIEEIADTIEKWSAAGIGSYIGTAQYDTKVRQKIHTQALKAFWIDIDVGKPDTYQTQTEAILAVKSFCKTTNLPKPTIVNSGYGVHIYWALTSEIPKFIWEPVAAKLKYVALNQNLKIDRTRTGDCASLMRPVGGKNNKIPSHPKEITLLLDSPDNDFSLFETVLAKAIETCGLATAPPPIIPITPNPLPNRVSGINHGIGSLYGGPEADLKLIAQKCNQIKHCVVEKGNVPQPLWYASLGIAAYCIKAEDRIHRISNGHPKYTYEETEREAARWKSTCSGATTCKKFEDENPQGCNGCAYKGRINSPITLGLQEVAGATTISQLTLAPTSAVLEVPPVPDPFIRAGGRIYYTSEGKGNSATAEVIQLFNGDVYPVSRYYDEFKKSEIVLFNRSLPQDSDDVFEINVADIYDKRSVMASLGKASIVTGTKDHDMAFSYINSYIRSLQEQQSREYLHSKMGWKDNDSAFATGNKVFRSDGSVSNCPISRSVSESTKGLEVSGTLEAWKEAAKVYSRPDMVSYAFVFLVGFAAPLLKYTGEKGALINMQGDTGVGKTATAHAMLSIWGNPANLQFSPQDTMLFRYRKMGALSNLPIYFDEGTNMGGECLSELLYQIPQGREKGRLNSDATEREIKSFWETICVMSTNNHLINKLQEFRINIAPEAARLLEVNFNALNTVRGSKLTKQESRLIFNIFKENYGLAGEVYAQWLVTHKDYAEKLVHKIIAKIESDWKVPTHERFKVAMIASIIAACICAKEAGLVDIDVAEISKEARRLLRMNAKATAEAVQTADDTLADFISANIANFVLDKSHPTDTSGLNAAPDHEPAQKVVGRIEKNTKKMWISKQAFKDYCRKYHIDVMTVQNKLEDEGIILVSNARKLLTAGTTKYGMNTSQTACWLIDLRHSKFAGVVLSAVEKHPELSEDMKGVKL